MKVLILVARVNIGFVFTIHCRRINLCVLFRDDCIRVTSIFFINKPTRRNFKLKSFLMDK